MLQQFKERAASIERELSQMIEGTCGVCEQYGRPIHPDRLKVLPDVRDMRSLCKGWRAQESQLIVSTQPW